MPSGLDLLMFFRSIGINLKQLYGSTETGFFVAMQRDGHVVSGRGGAAGRGRRTEVHARSARSLCDRPDCSGNITARREATTQARNEDGWFHTGDAGYLGDDGHLRIIDRIKDVGALNDGTLFAPKPHRKPLKFSHYIKEAVAFGHGRDMVCVLIDIDIAAVGDWADKQSISYTGHADLASQARSLRADRRLHRQGQRQARAEPGAGAIADPSLPDPAPGARRR